MNTELPTMAKISGVLKKHSAREIVQLSLKTKVPITTLHKIRSGLTPNPGIETVRKFLATAAKNKAPRAASVKV